MDGRGVELISVRGDLADRARARFDDGLDLCLFEGGSVPAS